VVPYYSKLLTLPKLIFLQNMFFTHQLVVGYVRKFIYNEVVKVSEVWNNTYQYCCTVLVQTIISLGTLNCTVPYRYSFLIQSAPYNSAHFIINIFYFHLIHNTVFNPKNCVFIIKVGQGGTIIQYNTVRYPK